MQWSATRYTKFERERTRPVRDLLARVRAAKVTHAADIGCGPGNSTEVLRACFPDAHISAIDSSAEMIEAFRARLPQIHVEMADISSWPNPGPFDVILANAALQWVPDHESLLSSLIAKLAPGGRLAVQIPDNLQEPAHRLMRQIAAEGPWAPKLAGASAATANRHTPEWYYRVLNPMVSTLDLWRTTYYHPLSGGPTAVVEWFRGTGLCPFLDRLDPSESADFLASYQAAIASAYPAQPDGIVLLPFPRLFFVATL